MGVRREQTLVAAESAVEFRVGGRALRLQVDQQLERAAVAAVHRAAVGADAGGERIQVQRLQGAGGVEVLGVVGDQQLSADEVDVRLDAAEAVVEGVEQRAGVLVVVVRVGAPQRARAVRALVGEGLSRGEGDRAREGDAEGGEGSATGGEGHALPP